MPEHFHVHAGAEQVTAIEYAAPHPSFDHIFILAHGAGAGQHSRFIVSFAEALSAAGLDTVTFNFPYAERQRRAPDPPRHLEACYLAVITATGRRAPTRPLIIGGKSMGGRIATEIAAEPSDDMARVAGLVLLGYPLHPPGKPQQLRTKHLPQVTKPMLFVQGSRDAFGAPEELGPVLDGLGAPTELMVVDEGDHSFSVSKTSARVQGDVYDEIQRRILQWIGSIAKR